MEDRLPRKLAAILYADFAGYSRLTGEDEDTTHRTLREYFDLISATTESHGGTVMHYVGDAVLAQFPAVVDALAGAVAIQTDIISRNQDVTDDRKVEFRIGVNLGDVIEDRGDRYILEGSVRRGGSRLRVTAQLLDSNSAAHVWADRYDGSVEDVFDFQDEITRNIVGGIAPQMELAELERARALHSIDLTAYELSLKAQAISHDGIRAGDPAAVL